MAKPNYSYEKRQRDLAKKKKKEEKRLKKQSGRPDADTASPEDVSSEENTAPPTGDTTSD
ncbi:MAG: hypothetical protein KUG71_05490 [Porticoccaceae bacterium]|nr:hypothetical protein [Porticoccaceae bacterium]